MSYPMYFPSQPFKLSEALLSVQLVNAAYDMYSQWEKQGEPEANQFKWQARLPKGYTVTATIWGTDTVLWFFKFPQPFAYIAYNEQG